MPSGASLSAAPIVFPSFQLLPPRPFALQHPPIHPPKSPPAQETRAAQHAQSAAAPPVHHLAHCQTTTTSSTTTTTATAPHHHPPSASTPFIILDRPGRCASLAARLPPCGGPFPPPQNHPAPSRPHPRYPYPSSSSCLLYYNPEPPPGFLSLSLPRRRHALFDLFPPPPSPALPLLLLLSCPSSLVEGMPPSAWVASLTQEA